MKTIIWDVDDVLRELMKFWFEKSWLPRHLECPIRSFKDITENPPHRLIRVGKNEYLKSLDEFRLSPIAEGTPPIPEIMDWFKKYGRHFRHIALTGTSFDSASISAGWVCRHFGQWIRGFHFIPASRQNQHLPEYDQNKTDWLRWFDKADILVEDNPSVIEAAEKMGIQGILIPRPWNKGELTIKESLEQIK